MGRVLVTGGAGFLGSHLCGALLEAGHAVIAMDNLVSGRRETLAGIADAEGFSFVEADVTEGAAVEGPLDWVCHLAGLASPVFYRSKPIATMAVGARGTHHTLELAAAKDAAYLFASTSEVYGDPTVHPQPEDYRGNVDPFGPRSCYVESKRYGEALVRAYRDTRGVDVRVARIFNTYGPRMRLDDGRVIPTFIRQALGDEPLTVHGDGGQTRSFCYVTDLIRGLRALMAADVQTPTNLGNPDERSIRELAELVIELTDSTSDIVREPRPDQDPEVRKPDISKARERLDWAPSIGLRRGLQESLAYYADGVG